MRKRDEIADANSCFNRAKDDEMLFVLLGRDADAPGTIRDWIKRRIASGKNKPEDSQLLHAEICAQYMEKDLAKQRELAKNAAHRQSER